ncbi:phosphoribosylamine--glycine ligase [Oxobacter pfennigii]|uniref:Phosphoribosylamine--glycine ligase n=1 Tax=Oxobacter pfennigii TaxID=36849 RepID=A0A0P8X3G0_9CLOT|nr:ATP-grasp domain-containing protein [Oxobacter pfennigii]KPU45316.1 phosphoribosylamine--glycine ligase [Oxobacter pfennigii]
MKLLILGGGNSQINAIIRAGEKGHTVIVSDYYEDAPGKLICHYKETTSTFDIEGNIKIANKYSIDGVMTIGTDQPVLTAAKVAEALSLPSFIDSSTALAVTNKKVMKKIFKDKGIPQAEYRIIKEEFHNGELFKIKFPVVVKPLDSQGQRGVYKLHSADDIRKNINDVLSYSREKEILVEEYYKHQEITISGWVLNDAVHVLTVTDRITYNNYPHIGICIAHNFPSIQNELHYEEILNLTEKIVKSFNIHNGPIYFQMLCGNDGIKVNEIACRIGGAYEDELIPLLTEVDILDMVLNYSLGIQVDYTSLEKYDVRKNNKCASVQMIFVKPGTVKSITPIEYIKSLAGVSYAKYNVQVGSTIGEIINATQRAGYMIIQGESKEILKMNIDNAFKHLKILDDSGNDMVIKF